jgi:hypothetical protein
VAPKRNKSPDALPGLAPPDHFVLTRFNVRPALNSRPPTSDWLRHRLSLFTRYCHPSLVNQTCPRFRWLVFLNAQSPGWFRDEIDLLAPSVFEPVWTDEPFSASMAANQVAQRLTCEYVITSRIDNDDAVARDYVECLQRNFVKQANEFVNFTHGLQLRDGRLYRRSDPANAFVSLIEKVEGGVPRTVFLDQHDRIAKHGRVRQLKTEPMWLQLVHDRNIANQARGLRTTPQVLVARFDVSTEIKSPGPLVVAIDRARFAAQMSARLILRPKRLLWLWRIVKPSGSGAGAV